MSRSRNVLSIVTLILGTFLFTTSLQADPQNNKNKTGKANKEEKVDKIDFNVDISLSGMVTAGISIGDARKLASRHGITGGKPLPPGIRKNLARGKPMPPGIQKTRMPGSFINELPYHEFWAGVGARTSSTCRLVSMVISEPTSHSYPRSYHDAHMYVASLAGRLPTN